jgi:hypothetical protein
MELEFFFGVFSGIVGFLALRWLFNRAVYAELQRRRSAIGLDKRRDLTEETNEAIAEVIMRVKAGEKPEDVIKGVAAAHPQVALKIVRTLAGKGISF